MRLEIMKASLLMLASATLAVSKEMARNEELAASLYDTGIAHDNMMSAKMVQSTCAFDLTNSDSV